MWPEGGPASRPGRELTTTFHSHYQGRIALAQLLDAEVLQRCAQTATGEKFLIGGA